MKDHKIWNSDLGRVFIERQDRVEKSYCPHCKKSKKECKCDKLDFKDQDAVNAEKELLVNKNPKNKSIDKTEFREVGGKLVEFPKKNIIGGSEHFGPGGKAIDKMLKGPINKEYDGMVKVDQKKNA